MAIVSLVLIVFEMEVKNFTISFYTLYICDKNKNAAKIKVHTLNYYYTKIRLEA